MISEKNTIVKNAIINADIVSADGITVLILSKLLKLKVPERVTGIDLMDVLLAESESNGFSIFLLGSRTSTLHRLQEKILLKYSGLRITGFHDGYFNFLEAPKIVEKINSSKAQLLFIGMSSPLKEKFIEEYKNSLDCSLIMGVGGSFEVLSGNINRSPKFFQNIGLEWLIRMFQEPLRLSLRYSKNFIYLLKLVLNNHKHKN